MVNPQQFEKCFCQWTRELARNAKGTVVAVDGKTVRGAYKDGERLSPVHLVSAWSEKNGLVLGQKKTDDKSNEITAIPDLLDLLMIKGCIVTIDAMGTQKDIAKKIVKGNKADYVLALKGNHPNLHDAVMGYFNDALSNGFEDVSCERVTTKEKGHGRIETREYFLLKDLSWLPEQKNWYGIKSVGMVMSKTDIKGKISTDKRFYICSIDDITAFAHAVRTHWGIESMHWSLDVCFGEDKNRTRTDFEPENLALVRKMTRNLLMLDRKNDDRKVPYSTNTKRYIACTNLDVLDRVVVRNILELEVEPQGE